MEWNSEGVESKGGRTGDAQSTQRALMSDVDWHCTGFSVPRGSDNCGNRNGDSTTCGGNMNDLLRQFGQLILVDATQAARNLPGFRVEIGPAVIEAPPGIHVEIGPAVIESPQIPQIPQIPQTMQIPQIPGLPHIQVQIGPAVLDGPASQQCDQSAAPASTRGRGSQPGDRSTAQRPGDGSTSQRGQQAHPGDGSTSQRVQQAHQSERSSGRDGHGSSSTGQERPRRGSPDAIREAERAAERAEREARQSLDRLERLLRQDRERLEQVLRNRM